MNQTILARSDGAGVTPFVAATPGWGKQARGISG